MTELLVAKDLKDSTKSGMKGISEQQIEGHYNVLYKGYVNKVNQIRTELKSVDRTSANATFSPYRELKIEEGFALDAVKLHELYFDNLGGPGGKPTGKVLTLIERDFGSYEAWEADLKAAGIAARGWVVTAYDLDDGQLHNFICDVHNQGGIWSAIPIVVLDVYEHAYFVDYGTRRAAYLDAFIANLDWETIGNRLGKIA